MSFAQHRVPVVVEVGPWARSGGITFIIEPQLVGEHSYLTGTLSVSGHDLKVRIHTLDNKTILAAEPGDEPPDDLVPARRMDALLTLRSPASRPPLPSDLSAALSQAGVELDWVDLRQQAYLLAFLAEARAARIRKARIDLICESLRMARDQEPA
jgi:hypothetical protein